MKKCPYCAEEIQDEATKCRYCGESLTGGATAKPVPAGAPPGSPHPDEEKTLMWEGSPSWRSSFGSYLLDCLITPVAAAALFYSARHFKFLHLQKNHLAQALALVVPLAAGAVIFLAMGMVRRSVKVRITNRSVENESGVFAKRVDVLELWRIRDIRYKQSFLDRILGIAHIEVFTKDVTTPHFEIIGMPASRQIFEKLRDNIEIQRQSKRVMGIMD